MKYFDIAGSKLIMANSDLDYGAYGDLQYENESMYVCLYDIITKELSNTPILCRGCNITSSVDGSKIIVAREDYDIMYVYDVKTFEKSVYKSFTRMRRIQADAQKYKISPLHEPKRLAWRLDRLQ